MTSRTGERLAADTRVGNYRIVRELGGTATGVLYAAEHVLLPRRALLKVASAQRPLAVQMLREACILEALRHAGVPTVYESGVLADGRAWFVLEAVEGERLAEALARGPMRPVEVAALVRDVATVLEHAHRRGIVHASLRPERIVLAGRRRGFAVCVTEWSDARAHDAAHAIPHVPTPGSRTYLAPEIVRGDAIDDRADIYALGVVAYHALTGALPADRYVPAAERCPRAPRELAALIDKMLARDRFDRPSSAEVVADVAWVTEPARGSSDTMRDLPAIHDVELVDIDGVPELDDARPTTTFRPRTGSADADPLGAMPRLRNPRWTPMSLITCDEAGVVAGEIDDREPALDGPTIRLPS